MTNDRTDLDEAIFRNLDHDGAPGPDPARGRRVLRRRVPLWLRIVAVPLAVVVLLGGFLVVRGLLAAGDLKRDDSLVIGADGRPEPGLGQNFLVLSESTTGQADVVLVVHLNQARDRLTLVSLPRNLSVNVGGSEQQLKDLAPDGSSAGLLTAVEGLIGARIEHVAKVDINGFIGLTETLGGVVVDNPQASTTSSGLQFDKGQIEVRGVTALAFVGDDSAIPDRDAVLAERQRSVLRAVVLKVLKPETLANPVTFNAVVSDLTKYVTVDSALTNSVMWDLATTTHIGSSADVVAAQAPVKGVSSSSSGDPIKLVDQARAEELGAALRGDTMDDYRSRYPA